MDAAVVDPVGAALDALAAGIDAVRGAPWVRVDAVAQVAGLERLELLRRQLDYVGLVAIRDLTAAGAPGRWGRRP